MDENPIRIPVAHATAGGSTHEVAAHVARRPEDAGHDVDRGPAADRREEAVVAGRPAGWHVVREAEWVVARSAAGRTAGAVVVEEGDLVSVEVRASGPLPSSTAVALVTELFDAPALRPARPVLVAVPASRPEVTTEVRRHLSDVDTHLAGATCLMRGRVAGTRLPLTHSQVVPTHEEP